MKRLALLIIAAVVSCPPVSCGSRTLTFDDVSSGTNLRSSPLYHDTYRVSFGARFYATDHTASDWGVPRSGSNVLTLPVEVQYGSGVISFGYYMPSYLELDYVASVGAYFSTKTNAVIRVTACYVSGVQPARPVASVMIGAFGESWDNRYVEIAAAECPFSELWFDGVNSPDDLLGFCLDDMTITYVPEPSSLAGLLVAFAGFAGAGMRRRYRRSG